MRRSKALAPILDELRDLHLFRLCSDDELRRVDALVSFVDVQAGHSLMQLGEYGQDALIVVRGEAEVTIGAQTIATVGAGELIGELSALDPTAPRSATVRARTSMRLLVLAPGALVDLLEIPTIKRDVLRTLVSRLREADSALVH